MEKELAERILEHLKKTNQAFCFYGGQLISRTYCEYIIN